MPHRLLDFVGLALGVTGAKLSGDRSYDNIVALLLPTALKALVFVFIIFMGLRYTVQTLENKVMDLEASTKECTTFQSQVREQSASIKTELSAQYRELKSQLDRIEARIK